jgi:hypothetical protein
MAQHIPVEQIEHPFIQKLAQSIRKQRYFKTSMKYYDVAPNVYATDRRVPTSVVYGGRATFEVHTVNGKVSEIYLVA